MKIQYWHLFLPLLAFIPMFDCGSKVRSTCTHLKDKGIPMNCKALDQPRHFRIDKNHFNRDRLISLCAALCDVLNYRFLIIRCRRHICGIETDENWQPSTSTTKKAVEEEIGQGEVVSWIP